MKHIKNILVSKIFFLFLISISYAQSLKSMPIPQQQWADQEIPNPTSVSVEENFWVKNFRWATDLLWFILGVVIFAMIVYWGFLLISAQWDEKKQQKAIRILINSVIWIFIALLAYTIVTLIIRLI